MSDVNDRDESEETIKVSYGLDEVGVPFVIIGEEQFPLASVDAYRLTPEEKGRGLFRPRFWDPVAGQSTLPQAPSSASNRDFQTKVRDQSGRNTCVTFAVLAAMEARLRRRNLQSKPYLSAQYANWRTAVKVGESPCVGTARLNDTEAVLKEVGVCVEADCPYLDQKNWSPICSTQSYATLAARPKYRIVDSFMLLEPTDPAPNIRSIEFLKQLVAAGFDIVLLTEFLIVNGGNIVHDVVHSSGGLVVHNNNLHAMLIVGYVDEGNERYFVCKNSMGKGSGQQGYYRFSFDYVANYGFQGLVIVDVSNLT